MIERILASVLLSLLKYLLEGALDDFAKARQQMDEDKAKGKINDDNIKAYEDAEDRAARRKAALDLLNGTTSP